MINFYLKCNLDTKRRLWENLLEVNRRFGDGAWCVVGDFNVVCMREERRRVSEDPSSLLLTEMNRFNLFLDDVEWEVVMCRGGSLLGFT